MEDGWLKYFVPNLRNELQCLDLAHPIVRVIVFGLKLFLSIYINNIMGFFLYSDMHSKVYKQMFITIHHYFIVILNCGKYLSHCEYAIVIKKIIVKIAVIATLSINP